jgi:hypothetical protein
MKENDASEFIAKMFTRQSRKENGRLKPEKTHSLTLMIAE